MKFEEIRRNAIAEYEALVKSEKPRIYIGTSTCGRSSGAIEVLNRLTAELEKKKVEAHVIEVGCSGGCSFEPIVDIEKSGMPRLRYGRVTPEIIGRVVEDYIVDDNPGPDLAVCSIGDDKIDGIPGCEELPIFGAQERIALRNSGYIDPGNINHYIARGGYNGLVKALEMAPEDVLQEINQSGLRGRGGAGFVTGEKWRLCRDADSSQKYFIANAAEIDPAASIGQTILEGDPHSVLEGILIGAYAVGANKGYIYVCTEHNLAIERLNNALEQMESCGLIGDNILDKDFSFHLEVRRGARAFICGEETALISFLEGKRGMPYPRPPYPTTSGLNGEPTVVNNVETLANVSAIMDKGAEWYRGYGTGLSPGTKVMVLAGRVKLGGIIEVPMGITLKQIIDEIGGGITDDKDLKAVQISGPSGGFFTAEDMELPIDFEHLNTDSSIMGSGSVLVADRDTCIIDLIKNCFSFIQAESCGKCVYCREGTKHILEIFIDAARGKSKPEDLDLLVELAEGIRSGSLCGLGRSAPNPVLTTTQRFRSEYIAHIRRKECPVKVCKELISYHILPEKCQGCLVCLNNCPVSAIDGSEQMIHVIDQKKCIKCGICLDVCPSEFGAVTKASGILPKTPKEPIPVGSWGKT